MSARRGWVYLVGAGPGDPALLTLRAAELIAAADVVLHDELIDPGVLAGARADAEVRSVGKRGSDGAAKRAAQDRINDALVEAARAGKSVVRLKGGDPFLFGRGAEEAAALRRASVPFEIVPGISSPAGATAYAGIPLTHRDLASSVTFITALQRGGTPFDLRRLAGIGGTLCVFMGARHARRICRGLIIDGGWEPSTPCAVIQWISYPRQRTITGTLADIADRVDDAGLGAPSLLVCGEVVSLREDLSWFDVQPLFGKRVLVTRPAAQARATLELLRRRGAEPVCFPAIVIEAPPDPAPLARAVADLASYDLVAFTSDNGVGWFFRELERQGRDARALGGAQLAAIGSATAAGLARQGLRADIVAETFIAESLAAAILGRLRPGARVLLPRALHAREALPEILRAAGIHVDVVPAYRTVSAAPERATELRAMLPNIDVVLFTSSSTVTMLCSLLGDDAPAQLRHCTLASIGPITSDTAQSLGLSVAVTAEVSTSEGLISALEAHCHVGTESVTSPPGPLSLTGEGEKIE